MCSFHAHAAYYFEHMLSLLCSSIVYATYLIFMFFVVVVLQSLLIAQMSDTFGKVQIDAARILILHRASTIVNIEETTIPRRHHWLNKVINIYIILY